jgi:condensin complex subunit 3
MAPRSSLVLDTLHANMATIFDQAQLSLANHRKNSVALYKLHLKAGAFTQTRNGKIKLVGEHAFGDSFLGMVNRVLPVKKGSTGPDRVVKFIGSYVKFVNEKGE